MLGTLTFIMVMSVTCVLAWLWTNGKLGEIIERNKETMYSGGRKLSFSFRKWHFTIDLNKAFYIRMAFLIMGPAAILGLTVAYAELIPLRVMFALFVLPCYLTMFVLGILYPEYGKRALYGFTMGVLATVIYDVVRMISVMALGLPDPIPHIGALWLGEAGFGENQWWVGYLWRLFGNGAGMGITYAMLPKFMHDLKGGWIYGEVVGLGMFAAMFFFPAVQIHLFPLNDVVFVNGILGHWAYGLTLGWIFERSKYVKEFGTTGLVSLKE